jgi:uncharacterized protein YdeI (BOF family)
MKKRIFGLVITASLISAGLLFVGTTAMGKFSPVMASSLDPLISGTNGQSQLSSNPAEEKTILQSDPGNGAGKPDASLAVIPASTSAAKGRQSVDLLATSTYGVAQDPGRSGVAPITNVTIAQLLNSPDQFVHKIFTITGIATALGDEKFLLNDGTGQILVELDDDLVKYAVISGLTITVTGEFDDDSGHNDYELDACTLTDKNGTVVVDDCCDDCGDDCNDDSIDDCGDDCNDGSTDDCNDDDDDSDD